eukprot:1158793-Pelagomonas_calceolata.AAC.3
MIVDRPPPSSNGLVGPPTRLGSAPSLSCESDGCRLAVRCLDRRPFNPVICKLQQGGWKQERSVGIQLMHNRARSHQQGGPGQEQGGPKCRGLI